MSSARVTKRRRLFAYETAGRTSVLSDPEGPECDDWFSLLVEPEQKGRLVVKIAVQPEGTGQRLRQWVLDQVAITEFSVSVMVPAKDLQRLRDALSEHLRGIGMEAPVQAAPRKTPVIGWVVPAVMFVVGIVVGGGA